MSVEKFIVLPKPNGTYIPTQIKEVVSNVIQESKLLDHFKKYKEFIVYVTGEVQENTNIVSAHGFWLESYFSKIETPFKLLKQQNNVLCPVGIVHVLLECIEKHTPNMGSYWGFKGYALSLLIDINAKYIWDARGQIAS